MQRPTLGVWRCQRAAGAVLVVASALAFALDGPVARAAYQQGLDPAAFGFWRALAGMVVLGGFLVARPRSGVLASIRRMRRPAVIRLALAAVAGLGLNLALFQAFARLPVAVAVAAFGCYPLLVAAWEAGSRRRAAGVIGPGMGMCMATVAVIGLVLLIRPNSSVSVPAAGRPGAPRSHPAPRLVRLDRRSSNGRDEGEVMSQDKQWFVNTLRNLGYTEAADAGARELPDPVSMEELKKFADRYAISRDEVMSQMGGSP